MSTSFRFISRNKTKSALTLIASVGVFVFFINATSLSDFPANGLKMNDIIAAAYPEVPCDQVIDLQNNGFSSVGSQRQNTQISKIVARSGNQLEITYRNLTTNAIGVSYMNFLIGSVSGGWGESSTLPGRITSIETLAPTSGNLLPVDGLKITGQRLNANLTVQNPAEVGYIFFTGNVKLSSSAGVTAASGTYINTFYANIVAPRPFGRNIFVGTAPAAGGTESTQNFSFKCYNTNPLNKAVVTLINSILLDQ